MSEKNYLPKKFQQKPAKSYAHTNDYFLSMNGLKHYGLNFKKT